MNQMRRSLEGIHEFVHSLSNMRYSAESTTSRQSVDSLDLDSYHPPVHQSSYNNNNNSNNNSNNNVNSKTPSQYVPSPRSTPSPSKNRGNMDVGTSKTEQKADLAVKA